ncbi:MAG: arginine--tRNA ligase [Candidatus Micrarchaeota archaeon]
MDFKHELSQALARVAGVDEEEAAASLGAPSGPAPRGPALETGGKAGAKKAGEKEEGAGAGGTDAKGESAKAECAGVKERGAAGMEAGVDWCSTLAFSLAKKRKENPADLAGKWARGGEWPAFVRKAQAAGPYLNFYFNEAFWWDLIARDSQAQKTGTAKTGAKRKPGKVLVEFPSVNPNKPWHVGHLRNALLGDSLARLLTAAGHEVERQDYIDDLGLQVAQSVWGRQHLPAPAAPEGSGELAGKLDHILGWQYVEVARKAEEEMVAAQVRALLKKLEEGTGPEAREARAVVEHCVKAQYQTAFAFGILHDALIFESDIVRTVFREGMEKIVSSGAVRKESDGKNAGCVVVKLADEKEFAGMESPDKVLIRSDGTATYTGKDVAFQLWKFGLLEADFSYAPFVKQPDGSVACSTTSSKDGKRMGYGHADTVVNVIGMEQAYPQQVIQAVLRKMGLHGQAGHYVHIAYEHVVLPEGRFSGRAGTWMGAGGGPGFTADELLREVEREAAGRIITAKEERKRGGDGEGSSPAETGARAGADGMPDEAERKKIAHAVSVAAIRFSFLRTSANQKITFDYDRALSLAGDSGPYVQYAYARAVHILHKAREAGLGAKPPRDPAGYGLNGQERALARSLLRWPALLESCAAKYQVHPVADYAIDLAGKFNQFYNTTPVMKADTKEEKEARLLEVAAFKEGLGRAMDVLGIERLERM